MLITLAEPLPKPILSLSLAPVTAIGPVVAIV